MSAWSSTAQTRPVFYSLRGSSPDKRALSLSVLLLYLRKRVPENVKRWLSRPPPGVVTLRGSLRSPCFLSHFSSGERVSVDRDLYQSLEAWVSLLRFPLGSSGWEVPKRADFTGFCLTASG